MRFSKFRDNVRGQPLFLSRDVIKMGTDAQVMRNQLTRWDKKGLIVKLKRGVYVLGASEREVEPSRLFIANQLLFPSYVSLEYALSVYGFIPERVVDVTSVTTKKTNRFKNQSGVFTYQHVQPAAFRGFRVQKEDSGAQVLIAEPEKAVVDFLYLRLPRVKEQTTDMFREFVRFQNTEMLQEKKIVAWARLFVNKMLDARVESFCAFMNEEK